MSTASKPMIVGLGPISSEIVAPVLGSGFTYIENPTPEDLAIADGALVRAAFWPGRHPLAGKFPVTFR